MEGMPAASVETVPVSVASAYPHGSELKFPAFMALDPRDGSVYFTHSVCGNGSYVSKLAPDGTCTLLAGGDQGYRDGCGPLARFRNPRGIAVTPDGSLVVCDMLNHVVRGVSTKDGKVTTLAGSNAAGHRDSIDPLSACFSHPEGVAVDREGNIFVADYGSHYIRKICCHSGGVTTIAGCGAGHLDGPAGLAMFNCPKDCAVDSEGSIFVTDTGNGCLRKISWNSGEGYVVSTFAGKGSEGGNDGLLIRQPLGVAVDGDNNVLITDSHRILAISHSGDVTHFAGATGWGNTDGEAPSSTFYQPTGLLVDMAGNVLVADQLNNKIRRICTGFTPLPLPSEPKELPSTFLRDMRELLASGAGADVTFSVGGRSINAHSCILAARSPYFRAMLSSDFKEASSGEDITVHDASSAAFQAVLHYLYTDELEVAEGDQALDLIKLAKFYHLEHLVAKCLSTNKARLTIHNVVQCLLEAHKRGIEEAKADALSFLKRNLRRVKQEAGTTLELLVECPDVMLALLTDIIS